MRIPFPERIAYSHALIFSVVLTSIQLFEGTNPAFAGFSFCFILVSVAAFNIAGGFPFLLGAYIGLNAILTVILPITVKVLMRDPSQSNLRVPVKTIEVYLCGMLAMCVAAVVTRHFRPRRAFISEMLPASALRAAYQGSTFLAVTLGFAHAVLPNGSGSVGSLLAQVDRFSPLAILLGVTYTIRSSGGRRSITWPLFLLMLYLTSTGLFTFSKEAFLEPLFCWAVPAAILRYRLRWPNLIALGVSGYLIAVYLMPYASVGRDIETLGRSPSEIAIYLLSNINEVHDSYVEGSREEERLLVFYSHPMGFLDRLEVISVDDGLVEVTDRQGTFGYEPIIEAFENFVPHFLWPTKPIPYFGNAYAHEVGFLSADDRSTGISFSPSADAYHMGGMFGVLLIEPVVLIFAFLILDRVIGDVRLNPVGLLMFLVIERAASEFMLPGPIYAIAQPLFAALLCSYVCAYVLPVFGSLVGSKPSKASPTLLQPVTST